MSIFQIYMYQYLGLHFHNPDNEVLNAETFRSEK